MSLYAKHVKKAVAEVLEATGQAVYYHRGEGNTLYYRNEAGEEVPVLDLLGGYGALILGHNHPEILAEAHALLERRVPMHAQFSLREGAGRLAARLNEIVAPQTGGEPFNVTFANSGAEAVEAAIKHAELDRVLKLEALLDEIDLHLAETEAKVRAAEASIPADIFAHSDIRDYVFDTRDFAELRTGIASHNAMQLARRPVFVALERSFHGKLLGSVQLTYGKLFRRPFQFLGLKARFVPAGRPDELDRIVEEESAVLYDLAVENGKVKLVERPLPLFSAFIVEPIQGEGGINVLTAEFGQHLRKTCNRLGCPLIIDEIQSGMGRAGSFLASSLVGLKGDYYTLSKSLGGGIAKISATLIRSAQYRWEFSLLHSSTFAEDEFSCGVALKVLDLLEADGGAAYARIRASGEALMALLEAIRAEYPDIIVSVRGKGLMIGVEFVSQAHAASRILRTTADIDSLGYLISGYLLRVEGIRAAPPGSSPNTLRLEPSMYLDEADLARISAAFRRVCEILRRQDTLPLVYPIARPGRPLPRTEILDFRPPAAAPAPNLKPAVKVAFLNHLISPDWLTQAEPALEGLAYEELRDFVLRMDVDKRTAPYEPVRLRSPLGAEVDFILYPLCAVSEQMVGYLASGQLDDIREDVQERLDAAREDGCVVAGLGMYTSIVTNNCTALRADDIALTSGNALTIAMGLEAVEHASAEAAIHVPQATVAVVGAAGNIATTYAALLAQRAGRLVLIGSARDGSQARLMRTAYGIYDEVWRGLAAGARETAGDFALAVRELDLIRQWLAEGRAPQRNDGRLIAEAMAAAYGEDRFLVLATETDATRQADIVMCAANTDQPFLDSHSFREGAVICDIAVPNNVAPDIAARRPDLRYMQGGIVATPNGESLHPTARAFLGAGQLFACMAETAVLGLAGIHRHFSYGPVTANQVREIAALAKLHGFSLGAAKQAASY
jgi:acetylornithine/succinyldiaminopimelate/putrescine aminotransferase/predicted amino acid dehydrogenase